MANMYLVGNIALLTGTFQNAAGQNADPTTVTCTVKDPSGTVTTPSVLRTGIGVYTANVDTTNAQPGPWWYRFAGTGALEAAAENVFYVMPSNV